MGNGNRNRIIVFVASIICIVSFITLLYVLKSDQSFALQNKHEIELTEHLLVPERLTSLNLMDLQGNDLEVFTGDFSYNLFIFGNPECQACSLLLDDVYANEQQFIENSIAVNFVWLSAEKESQNIVNYLEEKSNSFTSHSIPHLLMSRLEYQEFGFSNGPIPLIAIYKRNGDLALQSYGYNKTIVSQILKVEDLKKPFIKEWKQG